ncbi:MAG: uroporphyrinogen decarboxylase family protein [Geminicoccaceae bacterium]
MAEHLAPVFFIPEGREVLPPRDADRLAGAPWTLAAYDRRGGVEGISRRRGLRLRPGRTFLKAIIGLALRGDHDLPATAGGTGAEVIQLFDSWANVLAPDERQRWCDEPTARIADNLRAFAPDIPVIAFPRAIGPACVDFARVVRPDGLSLDTARSRLGGKPPARGSGAVLSRATSTRWLWSREGETMIRSAERIADVWAGRPYIFNSPTWNCAADTAGKCPCVVEHLKSRSR